MRSALLRALSIRLPGGVILSGLGLLLAAAVMSAVAGGPSQRQEIRVSPPSTDLGPVVTKSRYPLRFSLHNGGHREVTILGVSSCCSKKGCIVAKRQPPVSIARGGTYHVDATFVAAEAGPFACMFEVYTDAPGQTAIGLIVKGVTTPATVSETKSESIAKSG